MKPIFYTVGVVLCTAANANSQAVQVPLETTTGWGVVTPPAGYKALRIQGTAAAPALTVARLFGDFAAHPSMFPRVVEDVDVLACDESTLKARYRTKFDPRPGSKTEVESMSNVRATVMSDRIEFIWSSNDVTSSYVNAVWGRMLFVTVPGPNGPSTLVDYVSAIRPKSSVKGVLVETQKGVLIDDARYVINRLLRLAKEGSASRPEGGDIFNCGALNASPRGRP
jgi:hypothetical protein